MALRRTWLVGLCVAALLLAAPAAEAQEQPKIAPQQMQKAKEHFDRGGKLYSAGKYDEAIKEYQAAYAVAPLPGFLFNLGQAYRLKGDKRKAVEHYKAYLEKAPGGPGAVEAQSHVAVLGREIDAEDATARERANAAERERAVEEARRKEREAAAQQALGRQADIGPTEKPAGGRSLKIAGLTTAGGGVVLLGVGTFFFLRQRSLGSDLDALGPGDEWNPGLLDDTRAARRNAIIFAGIGGAAVATGAVLYYLGVRADRRRAAAERVTVLPVVGPAAAGVAVSWTQSW